MLALIDGDILTFQSAAANETTLSFGDHCPEALVLDPDLALFRCRELITDIKHTLEANDVLICFSGSDNFRYNVLPTYKHNRRGKQKPQLLQPLKDMLEKDYPCRTERVLEADDLMGILSVPEETAIATLDKDLNQIPGIHYNWKTGLVYWVTEESALFDRWLQVLTGDSTDGYTGIPSIGPKKATKLLMQALESNEDPEIPEEVLLETAVIEAYKAHGLSYSDYEAQRDVAIILTKDRWDSKRKRVIPFSSRTHNTCREDTLNDQ